MPENWKHIAFWASVVAAVCGALAAAPDGMSVGKQVLLGCSVALPLLFLKTLHDDNAAALKPPDFP